ncbi:MAG TPA: tryptophan 2,3-dioxygenase family protein [Bacteroidia bacterium]|nr:tryptophan 2,3-dioxygenase family protein [Bacteroidia bacterium]
MEFAIWSAAVDGICYLHRMEKEFSPEILAKLAQIKQKLDTKKQDLGVYLDALYYSDYLTYWNYIQLDTLLTLQKPITAFPDEHIFIMYHQITELYFKLCLLEYDQLQAHGAAGTLDAKFFHARVLRIANYFDALITSFRIMRDGMERDQFLKFRLALTPASGFQSGQYRMIEFRSTDFVNLVANAHREKFSSAIPPDEPMLNEMFEHIYWRSGATEEDTKRKSLTLQQFEEKYGSEFLALARTSRTTNLNALYKNLPEKERTPELKQALRWLDANVNVNWKLQHIGTASHYLEKKPEDIAATGGTNWKQYLPPSLQINVFFPELWSKEELESWGRAPMAREALGPDSHRV